MSIDKMLKIMETATKLKKVMQGKKIRAAKCKCPHCEHGFIIGRLHGKKDHLHMSCDSCSAMMME